MANISHFKETMKFPGDEDLNGAAVALTRLQDTYRCIYDLLTTTFFTVNKSYFNKRIHFLVSFSIFYECSRLFADWTLRRWQGGNLTVSNTAPS